MTQDWNPSRYLRFEDERTLPAQDLLARVPLAQAERVVDLGCGPGNSTELLAQRFAAASILGTDTSEAMLASARQRLPECRFEQSDVASWQPTVPPQLIFANAVLHWVPDHRRLLPRLLAALAPAGVLAVQMPDNLAEPTHRLMREVAMAGPWASALADAPALRTAMLSADAYYDLLAPHSVSVQIWRTVYHHPLASAAAIVDWLRGSGLRPFVDPLSEPARAAFLAEYEERIAAAYPERADGRRLLAFPRLFLVAQRSA
jgi:trans-aconitate 2-methyltransferase